MSANIRAVLFDLDNTLYHHDRAFEAWARDFTAQVPAEKQQQLTRALQQMLASNAGARRTRSELMMQLKALYPTLPPELEDPCYEFYCWLEEMALTEEATRLLDALDTAHIPFGIITNAPAQQNIKLDRLGLNTRAQCVFISAVFGVNKPDPAIFQAAAAALGLSCEEILFVGDTPEADICGAKGVGMKAAWLHHGADWPASLIEFTPDFHLDSLEQLFPLLGLNP